VAAGSPDRGAAEAVHDAVAAAGPSDGGAAGEDPDDLRRFAHRIVRDVTDDLERHRFNTAVAKLMMLTNEIRRAVDGGRPAVEASRALVQMLAPLAPFISEELWR